MKKIIFRFPSKIKIKKHFLNRFNRISKLFVLIEKINNSLEINKLNLKRITTKY